MRWLRGLRAVREREALDRDLDEELSAHLEMAMEENRRSGMSEAEARRAALAALGSVVAAREEHREARGLPLMETIWQDVRYSLRTLRRDAGFAVMAVLIAGLGVGACATVFSVVHTILLRSLPFAEPERLVWIANGRGPGMSARTVQVGHLQGMQKSTASYAEVAGYFAFYSPGDLKMTGSGEPERLTGVPVTANFFPVLGVGPALGRGFRAEEAVPNGPRVVMVSHRFWERRMQGDLGAVGRKLVLNEEPYEVIGVLPASFDFGTLFAPGLQVDVYQAFPLSEQTNRWGNTMSLVGRLRPGVTVEAAAAETRVFAQRSTAENPRWNEFTPVVEPLGEYVRGGVRPAMVVLAGAVGLVMLIVCANLSNLLLARATARQKEMAIRAALGAGRGRLIRQMLVESVLLSGAGAVFGLVLAAGGTRMLAGLETKIPLLSQVTLDWVVVGFTVCIAVVTGLAFGLVPALRVSAPQNARGASAGREHARVRGALVVGEVALACLLLAGSGLLMRSFLRVMEVDMGFQPRQALALRIDPGRRFASKEAQNAYFREALGRIRGAGGIGEAGLTDSLPLGKNRTWGAAAKGKVYTRENYPLGYVRIVSDGYFEAMGIGLVKGRYLRASDDVGSENVIVINETLARRLWPGEEAVGQTMRTDTDRVVVGVVRDVRHLALEQAAGGEFYLPMWQTRDFSMVDLVVRGAGERQNLEAIVRRELRAMDPTLPVTAFRGLETIVEQSVSPRRLMVVLLGGFAGFALLLASLGIYGVISYSVTQRKKEMGIRMALGATAGALRGEILWQTMRMTLAGVAAGLAASWGLLRLLEGMLYGVTASDPLTFAGALGVLLAVAAVAGYLPARRASRLDPVEALRME